MTCFWTDFVGCMEECTPPQPGYGLAYSANNSDYLYVDFAKTLDDAQNGIPIPDTTLILVSFDLCRTPNDYSGCAFNATGIAMRGESDGTPYFFWSATVPAITLYNIPHFTGQGAEHLHWDGQYPGINTFNGTAEFHFSVLTDLLGSSDSSPGALACVFKDAATGDLYYATGNQNYCR